MSTLTQLQTRLARDLRDPDNGTFTTAMLTDLLNDGVVEISRIAPKEFQEDVDTDGSYSYTLEQPDARVERVEVWAAGPPEVFHLRIPNQNHAVRATSQSGWEWWNETLLLPKAYGDYATADFFLRVWGHASYPLMAGGSDDSGLNDDLEAALIEFCTLGGFELMLNERALFKQWQAQQNNTDASMNSLISAVGLWQSKWERRRKQLLEVH
jgi:hypothetical protein